MTAGATAHRNADIVDLWNALERIDPRKDFICGEHGTLGYGEVRDQGLRFTRLFA